MKADQLCDIVLKLHLDFSVIKKYFIFSTFILTARDLTVCTLTPKYKSFSNPYLKSHDMVQNKLPCCWVKGLITSIEKLCMTQALR